MFVLKEEILEKIKQASEKGIVFLYEDCEESYFAIILDKSAYCNKKIEIWNSESAINSMPELAIVTKEEFEEVKKLYHTFEFSNRIIDVSNSSNYPSLFNYVNQGILTEEELVEALLYKLE